jgi:hypothetical protein
VVDEGSKPESGLTRTRAGQADVTVNVTVTTFCIGIHHMAGSAAIYLYDFM